jgi:hypothetical protein
VSTRFDVLSEIQRRLADPVVGIGQHKGDHVRRQVYSVAVLGQDGTPWFC